MPHDKLRVNERIKAMETSRDEFENAVSRSKVDEALKRKIPSGTRYKFFPRQSVYKYREKQKEWSGSHKVTECVGKKVLVDLGERDGPRSFNLSQVKPARLPEIKELLMQPTQNKLGDKKSRCHQFMIYCSVVI